MLLSSKRKVVGILKYGDSVKGMKKCTFCFLGKYFPGTFWSLSSWLTIIRFLGYMTQCSSCGIKKEGIALKQVCMA